MIRSSKITADDVKFTSESAGYIEDRFWSEGFIIWPDGRIALDHWFPGRGYERICRAIRKAKEANHVRAQDSPRS